MGTFEQGDRIYYTDLHDGTIKEGKFIEYDNQGIWLRLSGQSANKFVYSDDTNAYVFKDSVSAQNGLAGARARIKENLLRDNRFIEDILEKLRTHEGSFYVGIIKEILNEKCK